VGNLDALADPGKEHRVIANDISATHGGETDGLSIALTSHTLTPVYGTRLQVAPERLSHHFPHAQGSTGWRINLQAVMSLDDFDVVAFIKDTGSHIQQLEDGIHTDGHIRRKNNWNILRCSSDFSLAIRRKAGRADDHATACSPRQRQMLKRTFRSGEVDQAISPGQAFSYVTGNHHTARCAHQIASILADESTFGTLESSHQNGVTRLEGRFNEHPAHASGRTGNRDTNLSHVIPGIKRYEKKRRGASGIPGALLLRRNLARPDITLDPRQFAVFEHDGQTPLLKLALARLEAINIIPAISVKDIGHKRCSQHEAHLITAHTWLELRDHFLGNEVTLPDIDPVGLEKVTNGGTAGNGRDQQDGREQFAHGDSGSRSGHWHKGRILKDGRKLYHTGLAGLPAAFSSFSGLPMSSNSQNLKSIGLKATFPRLKILDLFQKVETRHLTAEDVYRLLIAEDMDIGLATVYRVLTQFEQAGLLERHYFESGKAVFELNEGQHHDHLVCLQCGKVEEFYDPAIEERQNRIAEERGFIVREHALYLYADCQKAACPNRPGSNPTTSS
jgi:Fur family transcriptional regulator, ferric uptake regulator